MARLAFYGVLLSMALSAIAPLPAAAHFDGHSFLPRAHLDALGRLASPFTSRSPASTGDAPAIEAIVAAPRDEISDKQYSHNIRMDLVSRAGLEQSCIRDGLAENGGKYDVPFDVLNSREYEDCVNGLAPLRRSENADATGGVARRKRSGKGKKARRNGKNGTCSSKGSGSNGSSASASPAHSSPTGSSSKSHGSSAASSAPRPASTGSVQGLLAVPNMPSGFSGTNNGIASWFQTDSSRDSTNGKSWCGLSYTNNMNGFAPDLSTMSPSLATYSSNPSAWKSAAQKYCGLEAVVTEQSSGKTMTMYIVDAFDPKWVKTPGSIDVISGAWSQLTGKSATNKNDVANVTWKLTGKRKAEYAFKG